MDPHSTFRLRQPRFKTGFVDENAERRGRHAGLGRVQHPRAVAVQADGLHAVGPEAVHDNRVARGEGQGRRGELYRISREVLVGVPLQKTVEQVILWRIAALEKDHQDFEREKDALDG